MIVRAIATGDGDWLFGKGKNDYLSKNPAIAQVITTRLRSFLGDCFFDITAGIDWFNLLGSKNVLLLDLNIKSVILNTPGVTGLTEFELFIDPITRNIVFTFNVTTVFAGGLLFNRVGLILTEDGDFLITEGGDDIHA